MRPLLAKYQGLLVAMMVAAAAFYLARLGWASEEGPVSARWGVAAALVPAVASIYYYLVKGERKLKLAVRLLLGTSFAALLLLATNLWVAVALAVVLAAVFFSAGLSELGQGRPAVAGVMQFTALWAIFLSAAVWRWPAILILACTWAATALVGYWYLEPHQERAARLLAATWGLIASQCAYVFSIWLVNYVLGGGKLVIPQAALVITSLGYVFGSIYAAHKKSQLGLWRLAEYLLIGLLLILIVAVGTKWTGSV